MIDGEGTSFGWLLAGVLAVTVVFNGIALALSTEFSLEADAQAGSTSVGTTQPELANLASPS